MDNIEIGATYRHFKGNKYQVIGLGTHTETNEDMVIYKAIGSDKVWIRPCRMWNEIVDEEKNIRRFEREDNGQI